MDVDNGFSTIGHKLSASPNNRMHHWRGTKPVTFEDEFPVLEQQHDYNLRQDVQNEFINDHSAAIVSIIQEARNLGAIEMTTMPVIHYTNKEEWQTSRIKRL
ncbi:uncharacterized protein FOMMEDRAFT_162924 [Fomitiporia mediterranea MF3/22]|uniref:Uncharacterized protein n=1 Tax=Fomitiporia mediterranea (strain MF3/22) TaxID=694068 RepID=R7SIU9_FOMME|nr:uncharacterized protein FOMMEDRAFT_162924 [Fomitiporia mediterranea MF3/22]EJC97539.1 hypothetical protein FOMMEDRAFT_162924 [Fomitiporia mediterranea MF3/22]